MASAIVVGGQKPYLNIRVFCSSDRVYSQLIFCDLSGKELEPEELVYE